MPRIDWPWSPADCDSTPTGQIFLTAPLSMARSSTSASAAAEHEDGIGGLCPGVMPGARVAEITIGQPRPGKEDELQDPIEDDGDLAEEELPEHVGRDQHVIEHQ